jgi:ssDNA-binding Zn-finger/Zn-ribbon topoisomerase 1
MNASRWFPCPVCTMPLEVRTTKKQKPYVTCDSCGVQMFVRGRIGIAGFERLTERAQREGSMAMLAGTLRRYRLTCPECREQFWVEPRLIETSLFDGSLKGVRCPKPKCERVVKWERAS